MNDNRTRNATRNIFFGISYRVIATLGPFLIRTLLLYTLGVEYLGLNSLFTSILSFLSLAELGIGNAMVYAMYKPIAEDNSKAVCALLNLYRQLYRIIGFVILCVGVLLLPFLKNLINGTYPDDINLYLLYIIYLFNTVISYFLFGYKQSILMANQRTDIISKLSMIVQLLMYLSQAAMLLIFRNYYVYIVLLPLFTVVTNFVNSYMAKKLYPMYVCDGKVDSHTSKAIKKNVLALVGGQLSNTVLHSTDNVVLSAFIGLSIVAIYENYFYILNAVIAFTGVIYTSLTAGLGNSIVTETIEKNYNDFKLLNFMNSWLVMFCSTSILCIIQPFMAIWVGKDLMLPFGMAILFTIYFYSYQINKIVLTYKDAAGLWWQDRFRPYVVMLTNVVLNIGSVKLIGVYGVIISSIVSLCISIPWSTYTVFKFLFKKKMLEYYISFFLNIGATIVCCISTLWVGSLICANPYMGIVLRILVCLIIPNVLYLLFNIRNPMLKKCIIRIKRIIRKG